ncbi:MAG TPA: hypothetical protein PKE69_17700 [Pyrinomonadaceae bacterium]|nr:hypothetical protein [Pyrinomonadaceae bacterium]
MNNWICPKCNTQNTQNFCLNCGASANEQAASDLPPTVFGMHAPLIAPPNQPSISVVQKKSNLSKILIICGIGSIILTGIVLSGKYFYDNTVVPYLAKREIDGNEKERETKAKSMSANDLLLENIAYGSQTVNRVKTLDKSQHLEASKKEFAKVDLGMDNINDAAAGVYATADKKEAILQIFKYNSTDQAKKACENISQEMLRNKDNFIEEPRPMYDDRLDHCGMTGETKNGQYVGVRSAYGFLVISSGYKDYSVMLYARVWSKLVL